MRVKHALDVAVRTTASMLNGEPQLCVSPATVILVCIVGPAGSLVNTERGLKPACTAYAVDLTLALRI